MFHDIVGYLLAALNAEEHERTATHLAADGEAQKMLDAANRLLAPLENVRSHLEAPDGLARRTCVFVRSVQTTITTSPADDPTSETPQSDSP